MDQTQPEPLDPAAFQRVWRRVMPEDRPDCPITVDAPAAEPTPVHSERPAPPPTQPLAAPMAAVPPPVRRAPGPPSAACLGEDSAGDLPALEALLSRTADSRRVYRALARRWRREPLLTALAEEKDRQLRRLSAAHFLIAGKKYTPPPTPAPEGGSLPLLLRERFREEQRLTAAFFAATGSTADPCLVELYRTLGKECHDHAARLRVWMERV